MAVLELTERCVFVPGEDVLHVLTARGSFKLAGRDIPRLHSRLAPFLQGDYGEAQLLQALPASQTGAVGNYLEKLREIGALRDYPDSAGRVRGCVSSGHDEAGVDDGLTLHVRVLGVPDAVRVLSNLPQRREEDCRLVLVVSRKNGPASARPTLGRAYGEWILRNCLDVQPQGPWVQVYRLDEESGALTGIAAAGGASFPPMRSLPEQLGVVVPSDVRQMPLCIASLAEGWSEQRVTVYGTTYPAVSRRLIHAHLFPPHGGAALPAASRLEALAEMLDRSAQARDVPRPTRWRPGDLLHERTRDRWTAYLQDVLRLRLDRLSGERAVGPEGTVWYRVAGHQACSFLPGRALALVLLPAVLERFYAGEDLGPAPLPVAPHPHFAEPAALREIIRRRIPAALRESGRREVVLRRLTGFGRSSWVAGFAEDRP
jgi:hypothetical protein